MEMIVRITCTKINQPVIIVMRGSQTKARAQRQTNNPELCGPVPYAIDHNNWLSL